jgi:hypothetical protein
VLWRGVRALVVAILSIPILWAIGANIFLSTSLFETIVDQEPEVVDVHFVRAWSLWPGRAHAEHLRIRGKDSNVEWVLELDEVDFDVAVVPLFKQQFHVTRARGSGISFRGRRRVESPLARPEYLAELPPIPGFPAMEFRPSRPPGKDVWSDADWHLWTIHLEDVVAEHVREVWVDQGRFRGDARIAGGFYLKPIRHVVVGPIETEIRRGGAELSSKAALEDLAGSFGGMIETFDPRMVHGSDIVHHVDLHTDLRARVPEVANLDVDARGEVDFDPLALRIARGKLADGSKVDAHAALSAEGIDASLDMAAGVNKEQLSLRLGILEAVGHGLRVRAATVDGDSRELDVTHLGGDLHFVADAPHVFLLHPRRISPALVKARASGRAKLEGWVAEKRLNAEAHVSAGDVEVRREALGAAFGKADIDASLTSWNYETGRIAEGKLDVVARQVSVLRKAAPLAMLGRVQTHVTGRELVLREPLARSSRWSVRAAVTDGRLGDVGAVNALLFDNQRSRVSSDGTFGAMIRADVVGARAKVLVAARTRELALTRDNVTVKGDVEGAMVFDHVDLRRPEVDQFGFDVDFTHVKAGADPERPTLQFERVTARGATNELMALEIAGGRLPDARSANTFLPAGSPLALESGTGTLEGFVTYRPLTRKAMGGVTITLHDAGLRLNTTHLRGNYRLEGRIAGYDPIEDKLDFGGSRVVISGLRVDGSSSHATGWEGLVDIIRGSVTLGHRPSADAWVRVDAHDASPVLGLLLQDKVPKFIVDAVRMPDLTAHLRLTVLPEAMALRDVSVLGGNVGVQGWWAVEQGASNGTFIVHKGPLSFGLGIDKAASYVRFFDLASWASNRQPLLENSVFGAHR